MLSGRKRNPTPGSLRARGLVLGPAAAAAGHILAALREASATGRQGRCPASGGEDRGLLQGQVIARIGAGPQLLDASPVLLGAPGAARFMVTTHTQPDAAAPNRSARLTPESPITSRASSGQPELVREQVEHLIERGPRRLAGLVDETQGQHGVVFG